MHYSPVIFKSLCACKVARTPFRPSWNRSVLATKSVSQANCTIVMRAELVSLSTPTRPYAARRSTFFSASARPFLRKYSFEASISPAVSSRAFMQSFSGEPVSRRNYFTRAGVATLGAPAAMSRLAIWWSVAVFARALLKCMWFWRFL